MFRLPRGRSFLAAGLAVLLGAAPAMAQAAADWQPNEDDALLFDARLGQYRLGDGVRGYQTSSGVCLDLGDMVQALDIPIRIDRKTGIATGWAFDERNRLTIDRSSRKARVGDRQYALTSDAVRDTPEGWCVSVKVLSTWLGIDLVPDLSNAYLRIQSKTKLPVELAAERRSRAAKLRPESQVDLSKLPQAKLPYRLWRTPSLDAVVTIGGVNDKRQGRRLDRRYDLYASGELAYMSVDARLSSNQKGLPADLRVRAYRSDYDGRLLGPLRATHFEMGDISTGTSPLVTQSLTGVGATVTNRPLNMGQAFDRKTFRGELPTGWDAELYRNGQLLALSQHRGDGRYEFVDVPLLYGANDIEIVLYGPQGQVRRARESIGVGPESIPPRKTWYWANVANIGSKFVWGRQDLGRQDGWRASLAVERGFDTRTSASLQVHSLTVEDERLTYVEGAVRRSVGRALVEVGGAYQSGGGAAARAQLLAQFGQTNLFAESILARGGFRSDRIADNMIASHAVSLDHTFDLGKIALPVSLSARYFQYDDGGSRLQGSARASTTIGRISITGLVDWRLQHSGGGPDPPGRIEAALLANGSVGKMRLRGEFRWRLSPENRFQSAAFVAERRLGERSQLRGEVGYDRDQRRIRGGLGYVRTFDRFALSINAEGASDGSMAAGLNLALSLGSDPRGGIRVASDKLASNGSVLARVFRDENGDGRRGAGEDYEKEVQILVSRRPTEKTTDAKGEVVVDGLLPHMPVLVSVDPSSLPDPLIQPAGLGVAVTPRPGLAAIIDLPLVGAGEILGTLVRAGGGELEGVDIELVNAQGFAVAATRSDFDGFFLFESVAYGSYRLRLNKISAASAGLANELDTPIRVDRDKPSVRLGRVNIGGSTGYALAYQDVSMEGPLAKLVLSRQYQ